MYASLIPVVTKEAGIDIQNVGVVLTDESLEEIERTVLSLVDLPENWHREHSAKSRDMAEKAFNEDAFLHRWREILSMILGKVQ